MIHRTRRLLEGGALLAVMALQPSLVAQEARRTEPAPQPTEVQPTEPERPVPPQAAPERPAAESSPSATRTDPAQPDGAGASEKPSSRREVLSQMRDAEVVHRERLAVIRRLRELAESQGQSERLALIDKLEVKEGARYNQVATFTANRLGNTKAYKQSLLKLSAGRVRRDSPELNPGADRKAAEEEIKAKTAAKRAAPGTQPTGTPAKKPKSQRKHKRSTESPSSPTTPRTEPAPRQGTSSSGGSSSPRSGS